MRTTACAARKDFAQPLTVERPLLPHRARFELAEIRMGRCSHGLGVWLGGKRVEDRRDPGLRPALGGVRSRA
jgi:hypothetical protein